MSELWEKEFDNTKYQCCSECGQPIYNGEPYYEFEDRLFCEDCMNNFRRLMDYDDYTYQDYLTDKYERERHDLE